MVAQPAAAALLSLSLVTLLIHGTGSLAGAQVDDTIDGVLCAYHHCVQRITANVDADVHARLEDLARRRPASTTQVIREALARYVTDEEAGREPEALPDWVGMLDGLGDATAEWDEDVLRAGWPAALDPGRHEG